MRIFIGLPLDLTFIRTIETWQAKHTDFPIRWTPGRNLHVTLVPPWETTNPQREITLFEKTEVKEQIKPITFHRAALGPNPRDPRLIWAEGNTPAFLPEIIDNLTLALHQPRQTRNFKTHITLARFKPGYFSHSLLTGLDEEVDWKFKPSKVTLFESILKPTGAEYRTLAEIPT